MDMRRTLTIVLDADADVAATLRASAAVKAALSPIAFNGGKPLGAVALQRACYRDVKGALNSQMTISATRQVAAAYAAAKRNGHKVTQPFAFRRPSALFLIGQRGRDADFRADGTLSIWTVAGRKRIGYRVPEYFRERFDAAKKFDSLTVVERGGKLIGRLAVTLEVPEPKAVTPVGIDLNETNAVVAEDADGRPLFISGRAVKVANRRTAKARARLQRRLATRKAERRDTRSVRRLLKRLGRRQGNRTRTFARTAAKELVAWAPPDAVLVFEDLSGIPRPKKGAVRGKALRRRLALWQRGLIQKAARDKAEETGRAVAEVDPRGTSRTHWRCGLPGIRKRHKFVCPACGVEEHADRNAARNIRHRFIVLRHDGPLSTGPEALAPVKGKPPASVGGR